MPQTPGAGQARQRRNKNSKSVPTSGEPKSKIGLRDQLEKNKRIKKIVWTLVGLTAIIVLGSTAWYLTTNRDTSEKHDHSTDPVSKILRDQVDQCETLLTLEVQLENLLAEDPFIEVVKTHIQPALDTTASIRTQTKMYEDMDKIPGGPVNFIETSIKRLEELETSVMDLIRDEEERILTRKLREIKSLILGYQKYYDESLSRLLATIVPLGVHGIVLAHSTITTEVLEQRMKEITFEELLEKVLKLAKLFEVLEETESKLAKAEEQDMTDLPEELLEARHEYLSYLTETLEEADEDVHAEIEENGKYYNLMLNFAHQIMHRISRFWTKLAEYEISKKGPYRRLVEMLDDDISTTWGRLENLKYSKS